MSRLLHLLRISWAVWRVRRAKNEEMRHAAKHALTAQLAGGRGLPMKIGQVLAGMDDHTAYQSLTQSVEPWLLQDMKPVLEQAWGKPVDDVLESIAESFAAASLGQVHQAKLKNGQWLAIKIQYPDIKQAIAAEMSLAGLMPRGGPVKRWDFDLDAYKATLNENMLHELDYEHEKKQQIEFKNTIDVQGLSVPSIVDDLCRGNVLAQTWVEGHRLSVAKDWGQVQRLQLAKTLMMTMFQSIFKLGLVHGDPHPGNLLFQQDGSKAKVVLLDFGCMLRVEKSRRRALLQLILAARGECEVDAVAGFSALGFDATKLALIKAKLPPLMQILFRPFTQGSQDNAFVLKDWHPGQEAEVLLAEQRWIFRAAGPADLFLMMRVFQGLVQQLNTLKVSLPWWPLLEQALPEPLLTQAKVNTLRKGEPLPEVKIVGTAKTLHIRISESGRQKAHIQLPAASALQLADLMPEEAKSILEEERVSLQGIEKKLLQQGVNPQQLVDVTHHEKRYHLWLE